MDRYRHLARSREPVHLAHHPKRPGWEREDSLARYKDHLAPPYGPGVGHQPTASKPRPNHLSGPIDHRQQFFSDAFNERLTRIRPSFYQASHGPLLHPEPARPIAQAPNAMDQDYVGQPEDYTFYHQLGSGAFGQVYLARCLRGPCASTWVAIKRIDKQRLHTEELRSRLTHEVELHWQARHPHIAALLDYFEDSDYVYLVVEVCQQGELFKYLRKGLQRPLTEPEARAVMLPLVQAVAYLHDHGVLHRDLKLANILLTERMEVKLCDFGLATAVHADSHGTEPQTMCGTPSYISPEIWARQAYGPPSDIWSLGCLFVSFLTGRAPFGATSTDQGAPGPYPPPTHLDERALQRVWSELPRGLSSKLWSLLQGMLRLNPQNRLTAQELLGHPFFHSSLPVTPLPFIESVAHWLPSPSSLPPSRPLATATGLFHQPSTHPGTRRPLSNPPPATTFDAIHQALNGQPGNSAAPRDHPQSHSSATPTLANSPYLDDAMDRKRVRPMDMDVDQDQRRVRSTRRLAQALSTAQKQPELSKEPATLLVPESVTMATATQLSTVHTRRLKPYSRPGKHCTLEIRSNGHVVADFASERHILVMNQGGAKLYLFSRSQVTRPDGQLSFRNVGPVAQYRTSDLPSRYTRNFQYISKFVLVLRSRTPRIVLTTPQAKCTFMENEPIGNIFMKFHNGIVVQLSTINQTVEFRVPQKGLPDNIQQFALPPLPSNGPSAYPTLLRSADNQEDWSRSLPTGHSTAPSKLLKENSADPLQLSRIYQDLPDVLRPLFRHLVECYQLCLSINTELTALESAEDNRNQPTGQYPITIKVTDMDQRVDATRILQSHGFFPDGGLSRAPLASGQPTHAFTAKPSHTLSSSSSRTATNNPTPLLLPPKAMVEPLSMDFRQAPGHLPSLGLGGGLATATDPSHLASLLSMLTVNTGLRSYYIPQVGWCLQSTHDIVSANSSVSGRGSEPAAQSSGQPRHFIIFFVDGILLLIDVLDRTVQWVDQANSAHTGPTVSSGNQRYPIDHHLPDHIKHRLEYFPAFQKGMELPQAHLL
ncbi:hypothetical protein H4R34_003373 [Dimargaris verticillata]|uniref:Non-specific serine/threonine protein kinase n=1 Tax=Dimargaris verticillata TaxID=2761393 RepID=A0A9W8B2B5_9FUNG|nr:hypothetical protein H4R34_003373 [Dimargaris verticillata]